LGRGHLATGDSFRSDTTSTPPWGTGEKSDTDEAGDHVTYPNP
jgi:hypothetical protein